MNDTSIFVDNILDSVSANYLPGAIQQQGCPGERFSSLTMNIFVNQLSRSFGYDDNTVFPSFSVKLDSRILSCDDIADPNVAQFLYSTATVI